MTLTIHHPDNNRAHRSHVLFAQVYHDGDETLSAYITRYKATAKLLQANPTPLANDRFGFLFDLRSLTPKKGHTLHVVTQSGAPQMVNFTYHSGSAVGLGIHTPGVFGGGGFGGPVLTWPLAGDTVTDDTFAAYGTSALDMDSHQDAMTAQYDHQSMALSLETDPMGAQATGAAAVSWDGTNVFYVTFMGVQNGVYLLTVLDKNENPDQQDPVTVDHP